MSEREEEQEFWERWITSQLQCANVEMQQLNAAKANLTLKMVNLNAHKVSGIANCREAFGDLYQKAKEEAA